MVNKMSNKPGSKNFKKNHTDDRQRFYRKLSGGKGLAAFRVASMETDLFIHADKNLHKEALELILKYRGQIERFIQEHPRFLTSMTPFMANDPAPAIATDMMASAKQCGVGPMAAVAGAVAEKVGEGLSHYSKQVIVENGGDIYLKLEQPFVAGIYAGKSPLSLKFGLTIDSSETPVAVCTSSGTIGHSKSHGTANAVCVVSKSCPLADAAATSVGNRVTHPDKIKSAIEFGKTIPGIDGIVIIADDKMGAWGDLKLTRLRADTKGKKG